MDKTDVLTDKITKNIWSGQIKRSKGMAAKLCLADMDRNS